MKRIILALCVALSTAVAAQPKKPKPAAKAVPASLPLKTVADSVSYAIGVSIATFYNEQGIKNLNPKVIERAVNDVQTGKKTALSEYDANTVLMDYMNRLQEAKARPQMIAGEKFLAENRKKPGVKTTASGLQYEVLQEGTGPKPTANDTVTTHYAGTLLSGEEFDNSYKRGEPITFVASSVIKGWTEALQLMPVGSKFRLYIPYSLGYGIHESGAIPGGSVLVFDVELISIKGK